MSTATYQFANAAHTLVLRNNTTLMFWHQHANTPTNVIHAKLWEQDGSPKPEEFVDTEPIRNALERAGVRT